VIAVIGDGAMSAGMAYEAMNNAGRTALAPDRGPERQRHVDRAAGRRPVGLSVAAPLGPALRYAAQSRPAWRKTCPSRWNARPSAPKNIARGFVAGGTLFEELGFYYVGPVDGHNLDHLLPS
jgi:1-deoxy-D-xylulose-5-phosphate synthase